MPSKPSIAVLGGGISGLSAAHYLLRNSIKSKVNISKVYLLEEQPRVGGWLQSKQIPEQDGYFELGPRTISTASYAGTNAIAMVDEIGLNDKVKFVPKGSKSFGKRYIVADQQLFPLPAGLLDLIKYRKPFKPFINYALKELKTPPIQLREDEDLSVHDFFHYRFGSKIADYLVNALCIGITGGDSHKLSMRAMFPNVLRKEQQFGSVTQGILKKENFVQDLADNRLVQRSLHEKWSVFSFQDGIETLPRHLHSYLAEQPNTEVMLNTKVTNIEFYDEKATIVFDSGSKKDTIQVDHVFSALPAFRLATILCKDQSQELCNLLSLIPTVHMAVVCFEFKGQVIPADFGFGFLVPAIENSPILGVTFDSCIFPSNRDTTQMTVMLGGYRFLDLFGPPDSVDPQTLLETSKQALKSYLNIKVEPINHHGAIHQNCIPQYNLGHLKRIEAIERQLRFKNLSILGASYHGFSVADCILNSRIQVDKWLERVNC